MSTSASAVVITAPGEVEVRSVGVGPLAPGDVLIRTQFSGVSTGTDKWVMQGLFTWTDLTFPAVPGYQRVGTVEAIGADVTGFVAGQHVVATESRGFTDVHPAWGGHVSLAATPCGEVYDASGIVPERAALFISGQVGFNAASRIPKRQHRRVVVFGDGIIGVAGALAARARGFEVLVVGRHTERLEPVRAMGILTAPSGSGVVADWEPTAVIDTVQNDDAFAEYVDVIPARTGLIVYSGHSPGGVTAWADMEHLQQRELTAAFVSGWERDRIEGTLGLMRDGLMPLEALAQVVPTPQIETTMRAVASSSLRPLAAVLDWTAA